MFSEAPPIATGFAVFCIFLFCFLVITWCCRKLAHSKTPDITLVPSQGRYISTIDVQTGLPVIIDVSALTGSRGGRARAASSIQSTSTASGPINVRGGRTLYGSIAQQPYGQPCYEVLPNTPPPPYSEVFPQTDDSHGQHR